MIPPPAARLFALAAALAAGVCAAESLRPGAGPSFAAGACTAAVLGLAARASPRRPAAAAAATIAAAALLGVSLAGLRLASLERSALARAGLDAADAILDGRLLAEPETGDGVTRVVVGVRRAVLDGRAFRVRERAWLSIRPPPDRRLDAGDAVRIEARLSAVERPDPTPQQRSAAARLRRAGVSARAYARPSGVEVIGGPRSPLDAAGRTGRRLVRGPASRLPSREAGLLLGVTIGDTSRLDPAMEADFKETGLTHLLAVSGGNVAMFLGAVAVGLRLARASRTLSVVVLAIGLAVYAAITGYEPSVLRAGGMTAVGLVAVALGARRHALSALGATAIVLIVWDPFLVRSVGFQLSALATVGIVAIGPGLRRALPGRIGAALAVSAGAQLAVAPLLAATFHQVSIASLLANLLAVPAVGPATVLGFLAAPLGAVSPWLGLACVTLARPSLVWMSAVAETLAKVPHASVGTPTGLAGALVAAALSAAAIAAARARRPPRRAVVLLCALSLVATTTWTAALVPGDVRGLEVTALDIGQGDAILVRVPGAAMLVDGGPDPDRVVQALKAHGVRALALLVLTHPHADHVVGAAAVARRLPVGRALDSGEEEDPGEEAHYDVAAYRDYLGVLRAKGVPRDVVRTGARYRLGAAVVEVLGPAELFAGTDSDPNNDSVVLRVRYGAGAALLSGDVQEEAQDALLRANPAALRAQVFKVPHHGSRKFVEGFYAATGARVALISAGRGNDFGHPSPACLDALAKFRMRALRTDLSGDVTAILDAGGRVSVREQRRAPAAA